MLSVSEKEFNALAAAQDDIFVRELARFLRDALPTPTQELPDEQLHEEIRAGEKRSRDYGIRTQRGVAQFMLVRFHTKKDFDLAPEINAFLNLPGIDGDTKIESLLESLG